jgi:5-methyltetrahydrofolate--homocysteine methyltransferase
VRAAYGFWPAAADGDDLLLYADGTRNSLAARFQCLRQQQMHPPQQSGEPYKSLADFVAPVDANLHDHVGAFAVTAGIGCEELAGQYQRANDDYGSIIVKALADRLAEAAAEWLHRRARKEWGYGADEHLSPGELVAERYRGIRPAFGYPACPDHVAKRTLFTLLQPERLGMGLTESCAMTPAASVSGLYLHHSAARYFTIGKLGKDQIEDYAARRGTNLKEAERWLSANLAYDPE